MGRILDPRGGGESEMRTGPEPPVLGVVLAGGASQRMGRDKAALVLAGETLLARVVRLLRAALGGVVVVGPPERAALVPGVRVVPDAAPGQGPLGAIATALDALNTPAIFVAACDMPFLRPALVAYLAGLAPSHDAVVPRTDHGTEQLCAVYGRGCLPAIAAQLAAGERAIAPLYARVRTRFVAPEEWCAHDPDGASFRNLNTPDDWRRAQSPP